MSLISVIVPIYRVEAYLEQCIRSIQNQTYEKLEILLVCKISDKKCLGICNKYAKEDSRIIVISQKGSGLDDARKLGIRHASGKYIGYVDGDDWIEPEMYEKLLEYANTYDVDVVESGVIDSSVYKEKKRLPYIKEGCYKNESFVKKVEPKLLYAGNFFEHGISPYMWSKLFLKEKLMKYQLREGTANKIHDDTMVSLPCIAESKKIYISHNCYYHYRIRSDSGKRECRKEEIPNLFRCSKEFYKIFEGTKLCSKDDRQIKYYMLYWLLYKAPYAFDDLNSDTFLVPFGSLKINSKIILYGAGAAGIHLENYIQNVIGSNIVCWVDQDYKTLQDTLGVKNPAEIVKYEYDYIVISIMRESAVQSVKKNLADLGVLERKILWIEQKYIDNPDLLLEKVCYQGKKLV